MEDIDADEIEGNMVEIREFVDAAGTEVSSEVVKLADEAKGMQKGEISKIDAVMEKLQDNLNIGTAQTIPLDEHSQLVRDLALLSHKAQVRTNQHDADDDADAFNFLDELEKKEERAAAEDSGHVFAAASSGWKKGFLGGGGGKPKAKPKSAPAVAAPAGASNESVHKSTSVEPVAGKFVSFSPDVSEQSVASSSSTSGNNTSAAINKSEGDMPKASRPPAFTGMIKERF